MPPERIVDSIGERFAGIDGAGAASEGGSRAGRRADPVRPTGSDSSSTAFMTLKTAVFAPIPSASVRMAAAAKPGLCASERKPKRTSRSSLSRPSQRPRSYEAFPRYTHIAERNVSSASSFVLTQAFTLKFVGFEFEVSPDLFSKIVCVALAIEHAYASSPLRSLRRIQNQAHRPCQPAPFVGLFYKLFAAPWPLASRSAPCGCSRSRPTWRESSPCLPVAAGPHRASHDQRGKSLLTDVESSARRPGRGRGRGRGSSG